MRSLKSIFFHSIFYVFISIFISNCGSSGSGAVDSIFGVEVDFPILSSVTAQVVSQTDPLRIDVNNIRKGDPGSDAGMSYKCYYDRTVDNVVEEVSACDDIPGSTVSFDVVTGTLNWTPVTALGNFEIKIIGTNKDGEARAIFPVSVRLKFNGITSFTSITGIGVTVNWTPNSQAQGYQISKLNSATGFYEIVTIVSGASTSGHTITSFAPSTVYTLRVNALDILGNSDGNTVSRSFTTTDLTRFSMSPLSSTVAAGTALPITITAFNDDGSPQTIGGLVITPRIASGTSTGIFSPVTDNGDGTYSFTFTPNIVGSSVVIDMTLATSFYLYNTVALNITPGTPSPITSILNISSGTVASANAVTLTALVRDIYNNPLPSSTVVFSAAGGTSTGTMSATTNSGSGNYSATFTGVVAGTAKTIGITVDGAPMTLSASVTVVPGAVYSPTSSLSISSSTVASGSTVNLSTTLRDINSNVIPSGVLVSFVKSGGTSTGSLGSVVNAGAGVYTSTYEGIVAGTAQTISVSVDGVYLTHTVTIQVLYGPVSLVTSSLVISSPTVSSGNFVNVTATLRDANSNPIDSGVVVSFTATGGTSTGTFGAVTNQGSGGYNVKYTGVVSGTAQTINLFVDGVPVALTTSVTVNPGSADPATSTISISAGTISAGATATVTATIRDLNSNPISSGILVAFSKTGGTSTGNYSSVTNLGSGQYSINYQGVVAGSAQTLGVSVDGSPLGPTTTVTVIPGVPSSTVSTFTISSGTITSGTSAAITANIRDAYSNPISSGIAVTLSKSGGTSTGTLAAVVNGGLGTYTSSYAGIVAGTAQTITLLVDGVPLGLTVTVAVNVGSADPATSSISITSGTISAGGTATVTATIRDLNSNPISSGIAVGFTKTGGTSTGNYSAITNLGGGQYAVTYQGITAGSAQTLGITVDSTSLGPTTTVTVVPGAPSPILSTLGVSANTVISGSSVVVTATIVDAYSNPISSGILVSFDKAGGTSTGTFGPAVNAGNGVYTTTYSGVVAGTAQTIQANVNLFGFGPTQSVQVLVGAPLASHSTLTVVTTPLASGTATAINALIRDLNNNPITTEYVITFDAIGGSSTGTLGSMSNLGAGNYSNTYTGVIAGSAQTIRALADGTPIAGLTASLQVIPGAVNVGNSTFTLSPTTVQSGTSATLAMNLRDVNSNAITSGLTITFNKTIGASDGTISAVTNAGSGNYTASYTATTQGTAQTITLVVNGSATTMTVSATVTAGPPSQMTISGPSNPLNSIDCNGPYTVTLKDASSNTTYSTTAFTMAFTSTPALAWTGTIFSDSSCNTNITNMSFAIAQTAGTFYYKSYTPQSISFTLTPSLVSISANSQTLTNQAVNSWLGSAVQFTATGSGATTVQDDTNGFSGPQDIAIDGTIMYVSETVSNRIIKIDLNTNTIIGWIGTVGSVEGITSYDLTTTCQSTAIGALTPIWCKGGRANQTSSTLIISPKSIVVDGTYIYFLVPGTHRILRFDKTTGSYQGWFGKISTTAGMTPASCVAAGVGAVTPTWCTGGTSTSGTGDGHFNNPQYIFLSGSSMYIADYANNRIQKIDTNGTLGGWIGQVGATAPPAGGQLGTCAPLPTTGNPTPGWCLGGVAQQADRYNLSISPVEVMAPNEGFKTPLSLTGDATNLYIGDSNARIVRITKASGAFNGYLGNSQSRPTLANNASPAVNATTRYTTTWSTGGTTYPSSGTTGFHPNIRAMVTDGTYIYFADDYHRIGYVSITNGQTYYHLGRASTTPVGGAVGCSSLPVGGIMPGWCTGGAAGSVTNLDGGFYNPWGLAISSSAPYKIYVSDYNNFRVQKFDLTTGAFESWIGGAVNTATQWNRTIASGVTMGRAGYGDYSNAEVNGSYVAMGGNGNNFFQADFANHRIKKFSKIDGTMGGYVGIIGGYPPTGPAACVGYTSGLTPAWCTGGGKTSSGSGVHGYNSPTGVTSDGTYIYIANLSNHRIDRVRISDGLYMGWVGRVSTTPTDGFTATCTSTAPGNYTPHWCIGGLAINSTSFGSYQGPRAIVHDSGNIYTFDAFSRLIRINATDGQITGLAANTSAVGPVGCTVTSNVAAGWCTSAAAQAAASTYGAIGTSNAIAVNTNHIFVADTANHRIVRYNKSTGAPAGFIGRLNTNAGLDTTVGTGGACAGLAGFPKSTPGWCFGTSLGVAMSPVSGTGDNSFSSPMGVWADDTYLYVSDTNNHRIVKIDVSTGATLGWKGLVATTAGMTGACSAAGTDVITSNWCTGGTSKNSRLLGGFDYPTGMWGDANYVYVYDTRNNRTVTVPR